MQERCWPLISRLLALGVAVVVLVTARNASAQGRLPAQTAPQSGYWLCLETYLDGDFREALAGFRDVARTRIITTAQTPWIDSICYHAMMGECHYRMGNLGEALDQYSSALKIFLANSNWMLRIEFDLQPITADETTKTAITWGTSSRNPVPGRYPKTFSSFRGRLDNSNLLRTGGVVEPPEYHPIYVTEIIRCTALAISRRRELMGPACEHDPLTGQVLNALARRPGPPNHWSQCWVELELGLAYAAANQMPQAATELQKSLLAAGQYDHALTGMSLLELGKLALEQGKFEAAITYFHEATISGTHFERYDVVEEAFRLAAEAHLLSRKQGVYPPLTAAVASPIMRRSRVLQVSLLTSLAEHLCSAGDTSGAAASLGQARNAMVRREMSQGAAGSRVNYQAARLALHGGDAKAAGSSLASALTYQRASCQRLFQIGLVDGLYLSGAVTERVADQLYSDALREPNPADWTLDPLDTLAMISTPHPLPYEHWFELALSRKEQEKALNIAERIRRHRFLTTQPLGGRLTALRWLLEGPPEALSPAAMLQRQDLLVKYPKVAELSRRAAEIKVQLQALPVAPRQDSQLKEQTNLLSELAKVSAAQESLLQLIALERVPSEFAFPPLRDTKQIQNELPDGTLVFYYFATSQNVHAFALTANRYGAFTVAQPAKVKADVAEMLRQMGNHDRTQPVDAEDLKANGWVAPAERLMSQLTNNTQHADWAKYRELIVVPDGVLWYLPFEALPVPGEDAKRPLLLTMPMRYSPTLGLAMADRRGNRPLARTAVVSSKLLPRDEDSLAAAASDTIMAALPGSVAINGDWRGSSAVYSTAFDRLIVLRDHEEADKFPFGWSPFLLDAGKPGSTLGEWMQLPFGGLDQIILPGVHTPAEYALKRGGTGDEIFLATCGLMASGCRTILMSRWRVGGQSTVELMREFAQELPHVPAADAWRRSVQLTSSRVLDPSLEGRLKSSGGRTLTADHPFFWAGYMLIDAGGAPSAEEQEDAKESLSNPARP